MPGRNLIQRYPRYPTNVPVEVAEPGSSVIRRLSLENISLGGAFVRELLWVPLGTRLQVHISAGGGIDADARAVHVVDPAASARKGHPAGSGLMFETLSTGARTQLQEFVEAISAAVTFPQEPPLKRRASPDSLELTRAIARTVSPGIVEVTPDSPAELVDLWVRELSKGRLFVHTSERPALRSRLEVLLRAPHGTFTLVAEVVHQLVFQPAAEPPFGVGLQLTFFSAVRGSLEEFIQGATVPAAEAANEGLPVGTVLAEVRRFFSGLDQGQPRLALGLGAEASLADERARLLELKNVFSHTPVGATLPQLARVDAALRALTRLERQLAVRDRSVPGELAVLPEPEPLLLLTPSRHVQARAPEALDTEPTRAVTAESLISQAEVFCVTEMPGKAREAIARALRMNYDEGVVVRAIAVCVHVGELSRAVALAQQVVANNPKNAPAWRALLAIYEGRGHHTLALRAAQALLRLAPGDGALAARVARLKNLTQRP